MSRFRPSDCFLVFPALCAWRPCARGCSVPASGGTCGRRWHQRGVGRTGFGHFGDGLVAEVVESQATDRSGGPFPSRNSAAKTFGGFERPLCGGLPADAPGGFANLFPPRRTPALLRTFQTFAHFSIRRRTPVYMLTVRPDTPTSSRAF